MATRRRSTRPHGMMSITAWRRIATNRFIYAGLALVIAIPLVIYFGGGPSIGGGASATDQRLADVIGTVNGTPVERREYEDLWQNERRERSLSDTDAAFMQGQVLQGVVQFAIAKSVAKAQGVAVTDEDIDKALEELRSTRGTKDKPLTDEAILQATGKATMTDVRDLYRRVLLPRILGAALSGSARLTESDLLASYDERKLRHILIGVTGSARPATNALPDAQARARAEKVLAEAKGGADFATLANKYTGDPSNKMPSYSPNGKPQPGPKGGDLGWYKRGGGFDPAFENAAFNIPKSEIAGPVKTPFGYHIIKVEDIKRQLPPDYEKNKAKLLTEFKDTKANEALQKLLTAETPKAKIVWKDPDIEWRYVYAKAGYGAIYWEPGKPPTPDQIRLLALTRAALKRNTSDSAAAFVLGRMLYQQYLSAGVAEAAYKRDPKTAPKPPNREALRTEAMKAFEAALARGEDREVRFNLAQLYQNAKQDDKALNHYEQVLKQLRWDDSPAARMSYDRLKLAFQQLGKPELVAQAAARSAELAAKAKKEADERAAREREAKVWAEKARKDAAAKAAAGKAGKPGAPSTQAPASNPLNPLSVTPPAGGGPLQQPTSSQPPR